MGYRCLFIIAVGLWPMLCLAQPSPWEVGILVGGATHRGDLVHAADLMLPATQPAFGLYGRKNLHPEWYLRAQLLNGVFTGDDRNNLDDPVAKDRLFSFTTRFLEIAMIGEWHLFANVSQPRTFSPFLFGGLGVVIIDPGPDFSLTKNEELLERVALDRGADYNQVMPVLPFGIGAVWRPNPHFHLGIEVGLRPTFTDYIDGISQAVDPTSNDWYGFAGLQLGYQFGKMDRDEDGVVDTEDRCPDSPGSVAMGGCPDRDQDGIIDGEDDCPLVAGTPLFYGCPDTDQDGIPDKNDLCPAEFGSPERGGCPVRDQDRDGIEDQYDLCPNVAGPPEREGCPIVDSDQDGILDEDDRCPYFFGLPIFGGCPDTDGDGIEDAKDACPQLFGVYIKNGCPLVLSPLEEAMEINRQYLLFEEKSSEILRYSLLDQITDFLKKNADYRLVIKGFADRGTGSVADDEQYARRRARACHQYLLSQGIDRNQLTYQGYGAQFPLSSEFAKGDNNLNNRVEFELYLMGEVPGNP